MLHCATQRSPGYIGVYSFTCNLGVTIIDFSPGCCLIHLWFRGRIRLPALITVGGVFSPLRWHGCHPCQRLGQPAFLLLVMGPPLFSGQRLSPAIPISAARQRGGFRCSVVAARGPLCGQWGGSAFCPSISEAAVPHSLLPLQRSSGRAHLCTVSQPRGPTR